MDYEFWTILKCKNDDGTIVEKGTWTWGFDLEFDAKHKPHSYKVTPDKAVWTKK